MVSVYLLRNSEAVNECKYRKHFWRQLSLTPWQFQFQLSSELVHRLHHLQSAHSKTVRVSGERREEEREEEEGAHHGQNFALFLEVVDNLALVCRFHTREETGFEAGFPLLGAIHCVKLSP